MASTEQWIIQARKQSVLDHLILWVVHQFDLLTEGEKIMAGELPLLLGNEET
jgi:hypothetical protein